MVIRKNHTESGFTLIEVIVTIVIVAAVAAMMVAYFGTTYTQNLLQFSTLNKAASLSQVMEKISAQYNQYPHWRSNTAYPAGAIILPTTANRTGMLYQTTSAGTSDPKNEPNWLYNPTASTPPPSIPDNTVTWVLYNAAPTLVFQDRLTAQNYSIDATIFHNNYLYVTRNGGVSGTAASSTIFPATPIIGVTTVNDGTLTWICSGGPVTVSTTSPTSPLQLQTEIGAEGTDQTNNYGRYHVINNRFIKFNASSTEQNINTATTDSLYGWYLKVTIGFRSDDPNRTGQTLSTLFVLR